MMLAHLPTFAYYKCKKNESSFWMDSEVPQAIRNAVQKSNGTAVKSGEWLS